MKIAIIGAGIFGITSALKLKESGFEVEIFEQSNSILSGASYCNQYRLHRGYHYPRSSEMIQSTDDFENYYRDCIVSSGFERYYAISSEDSMVSSNEYLDFLNKNQLKYQIIPKLDILKSEEIDLIVKVQENSFDIGELYLTCTKRLRENNIKVRLGEKFTNDMISEYDIVVNCTYSNLNFLLDEKDQIDYQFELCEKPIISLGKEFQRKSVVIMDGEFCCIDPFGNDGYYHVLGHVKEAIHDRQIGKFYQIPETHREVLKFKTEKYFKLSKHREMINSSKRFFNFKSRPVVPQSSKKPTLLNDNVFYLTSMFTVRTVLPNRDHDDARPTQLIKHSEKLYSIFSGKIGTSVSIADQLIKMI